MPLTPREETMLDQLRELERRVTILERAAPALLTVPLQVQYFTSSAVPVSGSDFTSVIFVARVVEPLGDAVYVEVPWATGGATTGEMRLRDVDTGLSTDAVALPAASVGTQIFRWKHGHPKGQQPFRINLEARRTSGALTVDIYLPTAAWMSWSAGIDGATPSGV